MKLCLFFVLVITLPVAVLAQDANSLQQQANVVAKALMNGDYKLIVDNMYPKLVTRLDGKEKVLQQTALVLNQMKASGFSFVNAVAGTPGKFYKAGTEIHCLVPETIALKTPNGVVSIKSNLLAVSRDGGKKWTFLDINKNTIAAIPQLFPHFNKALKLPQPSQPFM